MSQDMFGSDEDDEWISSCAMNTTLDPDWRPSAEDLASSSESSQTEGKHMMLLNSLAPNPQCLTYSTTTLHSH